MPKKQCWVLTDHSRRNWTQDFRCGPETTGKKGKHAWSIIKKTLHGGLSEGVEIIEVDNGAFLFTLLPTRGMGIWRGVYNGVPVGWESPVRGPVHPGFVDPQDRGGLGWLQGFDELIVRCGLASNGAPCEDTVLNNGAPAKLALTLHGRIALQPACQVTVEVMPGPVPELSVIGVVEESSLFYPQLRLTTRISTKAGSNAFTLEDRVENLSAVEAEMELLYHCNFGKPFLEDRARFRMPAEFVLPRDAAAAKGVSVLDAFKGPTPGFAEECFFWKPRGDRRGDTLALLRNAAGSKGVGVRFNLRTLPAFTLWKNTAAVSDGYVTGLEPATNYPNPKPFERQNGRVVKLPPFGSYQTRLTLEVYDTRKAVQTAEREVEKLQKGMSLVRHGAPVPGYAPGA
jgi:hypothetical protein